MTNLPRIVAVGALLAAVALLPLSTAAADQPVADTRMDLDPSGVIGSISVNGDLVDSTNRFFQPLGSNGRTCATCHVPSSGWTLSPTDVRARFGEDGSTDPLFTSTDGAVSDAVDLSTAAGRKQAFAPTLDKGLIRMVRSIPEDAEFQLETLQDPYESASAGEISVFRRPRPTAGLRFAASIMWDGSQTPSDEPMLTGLQHQANDAVLRHEQAGSQPSVDTLEQIATFETGLYAAQVRDNAAGDLQAGDARGGLSALVNEPFGLGMNDSFQSWWNPNVFNLFGAWSTVTGGDGSVDARRSIARGEQIFNQQGFVISGVAGLNDSAGASSLAGTCSTCHNTPGVGNHSISAALNIGTADASHRTPDLPLYELVNLSTGERLATTDPGRALVTGRWSDIGKFYVPTLRGLAARAPYFHNGMAATLEDLVNFYNLRFQIGLSDQQKTDLVAFLRAL